MRNNSNALVAIADGTVIDDYGNTHHIRAGKTRWDRSSSELRRSDVAALFGLTTADGFSGPSRSRSTTTAPRPPRPLELEIPELRSSQSPVDVVLTRSARKMILDDLFWTTRTDGLEAGGFLWARPSYSWRKQIEVLYASDTGDAQRTTRSIKLDTAPWAEAERAIEDKRLDLTLCGMWHSHADTRDDRPSDVDLRSWLAALDWNAERGRSAPFSVGLIYSASPYLGDSWATPRLSSWVVRRADYWGRPGICEPATIRERR